MSLLNRTLFKVYADSKKDAQDDGGPVFASPETSCESAAPGKSQPLPERIERGPLAPTNLIRGISLTDPDFNWSLQGPCGPEFLQKNDLSLDSMFKRQRAVEGVCGKKLEPSEQRISMMTLSTSEKVRSFQKTKTGDPDGSDFVQESQSRETPAFDSWLRSPDVTAEAQLRRADEDGILNASVTPQRRNRGASIHWKAKKQSFDLMDDCNEHVDTREDSLDIPDMDFSVPDFSMLNLSLSNLSGPEEPIFGDTTAPRVPTSGGATSDAPAHEFPGQLFSARNPGDESPRTVEEFRFHIPPTDAQGEPATDDIPVREIPWHERILTGTPRRVTAFWPESCEKMRTDANSPVTALVDYLEQQMEKGLKLLSFCGNRPGSGCSTILLCCARELARRGRKTLLLDGHFERPALAGILNVEYRNENNEGDTTILTLEKNLDLLPMNSEMENMALSQFGWCRELQERYEIILIDSGCFLDFRESELQRKANEFRAFGVRRYFMILGGEPSHQDAFQNDCQELDTFMRRHAIARIGVAENY